MTSHDQIELSVIMPVYNGEHFLASALQSLVVQQRKGFEVILLDDGSSDQSVALAKSFAENLPLQIIERDHAGNWPRLVNAGIDIAQGRYLSMLHQDDLWLPNRLEVLFQKMKEHPEAQVFVNPSWFVDGRGRKVGQWNCPFGRKERLLDGREVAEKLLVQNFIAAPAVVWKKESPFGVQKLDDSLWYTADWKLWLSLAQESSWCFIPEILTAYRIHGGAQTVQGGFGNDDYRKQHELVLDEFLPEALAKSDRPVRLEAMSRLSVEVNMYFLSRLQEESQRVSQILAAAKKTGFAGVLKYVFLSRIVERLLARLHVQLVHGFWRKAKEEL